MCEAAPWFCLRGIGMLNLYLDFDHRTRRMVAFRGEGEDEAILYVPKPFWEVMGRPRHMRVELTPEEEHQP